MKLLSLGFLGSFIAIGFITGSTVLGFYVDGYSFISNTLSEIGSMTSPMHRPFQIFKICIALLILLFAFAVFKRARTDRLSVLPPVFLFLFGISDLGLALFPTPHPVHNAFGLSLTLGYLSPLIFALMWKDRLGVNFGRDCFWFFVLVVMGIFLNLSPAFKPDLYPLKYYGLVQRFLVFTMFSFFAFLGKRIDA